MYIVQDQWDISANASNFFGFITTHSFTNSTLNVIAAKNQVNNNNSENILPHLCKPRERLTQYVVVDGH